MTQRHPRCGATAQLNYLLHNLPRELRPASENLPPHPEDDAEDGKAELARLHRELREARTELARLHGQPALFEP